jgi:hypothetical protein
MDVLTAYVAAGGSLRDAAKDVGIRPSTAKRHLADLRARSGVTTEQLIYTGRASGRLSVPGLEPAELPGGNKAQAPDDDPCARAGHGCRPNQPLGERGQIEDGSEDVVRAQRDERDPHLPWTSARRG